MFKLLLKKLSAKLEEWTKPEQDELVLALVMGTASLALDKGETVTLAPIRGTCGPIYLTGNSLPVFEYRVFEKAIMEFIKVRVEVAKPDRITYICNIESQDLEANGKPIDVVDRYKAPFQKLSLNLFRYFPLYRKETPTLRGIA